MAKNLEQRLANKPATGATPSLTQSIQRMEEQFALAMPKGAEAAQLVRDALTCVRQTPNLAQCDHATVLGGLMTCAQLGLRPGVLGQAWLIPFKNNRAGRYEAQVVIGYHGLVELAHRSGKIKSLIARTVYENDHFDVDYGLEDKLVHKPCLTGEKGKPIAYYAVARLTTGGHAFFVMSHDEMMAYKRQNAKSPNRGPWADNFEQMAHKGLAVDTPIPTPAGWTIMGDVRVGDTVFDMHGKRTIVTAKSEVKHIDCYRVTFQNGASITCDGEHRWLAGVGSNAARDVREKGWGVYEIGELYTAHAAGKAVTMPVTGALDTEPADLPVDPWALGYWLGNGAARAGRVTCSPEDADAVVEAFESRGITVGARYKDKRSNAEDVGLIDGFVTRLREAGVYQNKHIPAAYFRASTEQRRGLLAGLMDSDGSIDKSRGRAIFVSVDKGLSDGVAELARSLGEIVSQRVQKNNGFGKEVMTHVVQWTPNFPPVTLPRKVERLQSRKIAPYRAVRSIEKVDTVPTQCISVDSETRTYVAGIEMVPTHNTTVRQLAKWLPKSTDMATAIENDGATRIDLAPAALSYPRHEDTGHDGGAVDGEVIDNDDTPVIEPDGVNAPVEN
ncbi:recombinase RecT [Corynebacterium macclintockiae]|uniref:recombinase RecT n=1 Tax=Corynebacterium macclintockiae TaxID=2913501 RepID=UPI003EB9AEFE